MKEQDYRTTALMLSSGAAAALGWRAMQRNRPSLAAGWFVLAVAVPLIALAVEQADKGEVW